MSPAANGRVLVTGADGFIGSHLVEELVRGGASVRAFVLYNSFNSWGWLDRVPAAVRDSIEVVAGDVRDRDSVRAAAKGCARILNLAALISIPFSYEAPEAYVDVNVKGALNVANAAREHGAERLVQVSTSEVYGTARSVPISEEHPLNGQSPYAASKIGADQMALSFHAAFGVPVTVVRPFNTYGPCQKSNSEGGVVSIFLMRDIAGQPLKVKGSGLQTRDLLYVEDCADFILAASTSEQAEGQIINAGTGHEVSIIDLAGKCRTGSNTVEKVPHDHPQAEIMRLRCDSSKAARLLSWRPTVSLDEGLRRTRAWLTDNRWAW